MTINLMAVFKAPATAESMAETLVETTENASENVFEIGTKLIDILVSKASAIVGALIILVIGWYFVGWFCKIIKKSLDRSQMDASVSGFINSGVKFGLRILLGIMVVTKLGVDTTSIIALITSASLAVGLALQGSLANLAGGVLILIMRPFKVGDYIKDGSGHEGTVESIEIIYTRLRTADNQIVCVPKGGLAATTITNVNREETRRIIFNVSIDYAEDIDVVRDVLLGIAEAHPYIDKVDKPPFFYVDSLGESAVNVALRIWCPTENYWDVKWDMNEMIKKTFDANGIKFPYNHLDVTVCK